MSPWVVDARAGTLEAIPLFVETLQNYGCNANEQLQPRIEGWFLAGEAMSEGYYPILVDLRGKKVLVVGGGNVAQRKIETLLEYGASVYVVSRDLTEALRRTADAGGINVMGYEFGESHLDGVFMVIAATDDSELNQRVSRFARDKGVLVNAVDQPLDCTFIVPAILRRGDLLIAVSTSGKSPALARKIKEELESFYGSEYEAFLVLMGRLRKEILGHGFPQHENRRIFQELVASPILEALRNDAWETVASILNRILKTRLSAADVRNYLEVE
jgi:precorrin-2 dehydrogenase/sirohydrochlorin ferrochelatase